MRCPSQAHAEPGTGADALQLTLVPRFSFRARLTASVRPQARQQSMVTAIWFNTERGRT
jgi:hypothetical protein